MYCSSLLAHWFYSSTLHSWFSWNWNKIPVVYLQNCRLFLWRTESEYLACAFLIELPVLLWVLVCQSISELGSWELHSLAKPWWRSLCVICLWQSQKYFALVFLMPGWNFHTYWAQFRMSFSHKYLLPGYYKGHGNWSQMEVTLHRGENKEKLPFLLETKAIPQFAVVKTKIFSLLALGCVSTGYVLTIPENTTINKFCGGIFYFSWILHPS